MSMLMQAADSSVHLNLALKHLETVQAIDAQLERDRANLDLFTKLHSEVLYMYIQVQ